MRVSSDDTITDARLRTVAIFKAQSNEQISRLYQDLGCEYHLVQDATFVPIVPALTPVGFARKS
jgi:hypothetical protein